MIRAAMAAGLLLAPQQQPHTIRVPVRLVLAPTTVTDQSGRFVNDLGADEFTLIDNGLKQAVHLDEVEFAPMSLAIVVQSNLAVQGAHERIQTIGPLIETLIMGERGAAAVLTFDSTVRTVQPFTSDGEKIRRALKRMTYAGGKARMIDAALAGIEELKQRRESRRVLLLISEARDSGSESRLRDVISEAELQNVIVYSLNVSRLHAWKSALNLSWSAPPETPYGTHHGGGTEFGLDLKALITEIYSSLRTAASENPLKVITEYTGGRQFSFFKQHSLEEALTRLGDELHGQYMLSFTPNPPTGGYHEIRVHVSRSGMQVRSRPGYWIGGSTQASLGEIPVVWQ